LHNPPLERIPMHRDKLYLRSSVARAPPRPLNGITLSRFGGYMHTRRQLAWMLVGLGFSIAVTAVVAAGPAEKPRTTWEYKFLSSNTEPPFPDNGSDSPNVQGSQGWELVSATVDSNNRYCAAASGGANAIAARRSSAAGRWRQPQGAK
jgi:hypothetical protein